MFVVSCLSAVQGALENLPADIGAGQEAGGVLRGLPPRSMADRAVRAAALQPLSSSRAEALGVKVGVCLCAMLHTSWGEQRSSAPPGVEDATKVDPGSNT